MWQIKTANKVSEFNGLGDAPFEVFIEYWKGNITNTDSVEQGFSTIWEEVNFNHGCTLVVCYSLNQIKRIINTYGDAVMRGDIDEYDRSRSPQKVRDIELYVGKITNEEQKLVDTVLYNLYYATMQSRVRTRFLLYPKTTSLNEKYTKMPQVYKDNLAKSGFFDFLSDIPDALKTTGYFILGGLGLYAIIQIAPLINSFKKNN